MQTFGQLIANRHLASLKVTSIFFHPELRACLRPHIQIRIYREEVNGCVLPASLGHTLAYAKVHTSQVIQGHCSCQALFCCPVSLSSASGLLMESCLNCPSFKKMIYY